MISGILEFITGFGDMIFSKKEIKSPNINVKEIYYPKQIAPKKYSFRPKTLDEYIGQDRAKELVRLNLEKVMTIKPVHFLINGTQGCFIAGTKVLMGDYTWNNIEKIKVGDIIMGFDEYGSRNLKPSMVLKTHTKQSSEFIYFKTNKNDVWTTPEHPFLFTQHMQSSWRTIGNINKLSNELYNFPIKNRNDDWEMGWMIGFLLSDGSLPKHNKHIYFYNKNKELINKISIYLIKKNIKHRIYLKENKVYQLYIYNKKLKKYLLETKNRIYRNINSFGNDTLRGILAGFYDGDGSYDKSAKRIVLFNSNKKLLKVFIKVAKRLDLKAKLHKRNINKNKIIFGKYKSKKDAFKLYISSALNFYCICQPFSKLNYPKIKQASKQKRVNYKKISISDFKKINHKKEYDGVVYNLTTSTNTYIANGFPVHNCGKSSLAYILARQLDFKIHTYIGGSFTMDNLKQFLMENEENYKPHILFIDEIHGLSKEIAEFMYPLLEDFIIPINDVKVRPFIFIGATTEKNTLIKKFSPLVDRCGAQINLEHYNKEDIKKILKQYNEQVHKLKIEEEIYDILSVNTRFNPRVSISLFDDYVVCKNIKKVLNAHRIIKNSLTTDDILLLEHLKEIGKPVGMKTLAIIAQQTEEDYRGLIEPFLIQQGYISATSRGRIITNKGRDILNELEK